MKLGLIAMSGVRAQNKELTALGLTLPGFVERSKTIASLPSLGLLTLGGMAGRDFDVTYLEVPDLAAIPDIPGEFDVVGISSFSAQIKEAYTLADRYRDAGTTVILGGLHVSAVPDEAADHADAIVIGEGETAWPEVLQHLRERRLQRVYDARPRPFDLADAPMPAFELLDPDRYNRLTVQTQRGCPWRCEFCAASMRISPTFKIKPVQKVIAEIRKIRGIWDHPFIEFADDNTFVNRKHAKVLLRAMEREGVRWFTESDLSIADDDELLGLMRDSGCAQVLIGLESPSRTGLEGLEMRANWKARQLDRYMTAIRRIQDHGITVNGCFILGLDGSDAGVFDDVWQFVKDSGLYEVQVTVLTPFPGTPLYARLLSEGRILNPGAWELCTLFDVNFKPDRMTVAELEQGLRDLAVRLYNTDFTRERRESYRHRLRLLANQTQQQREAS
jgi:radical SAM superfamily enzyme YgiQ (UPF0313 family)